LFVLGVVVLLTGSGLAIMNNACKSSHHAWCGSMSDIRHHVKTGHSLIAVAQAVCCCGGACLDYRADARL
jgi:hypothetical protein